ncbi:uncharacterized protein [Diadema antillarum]|uniref:uncharacterized protein n=1 Tax=Diadema antillarum TaxID=105358 RepID=UPI003A89A8AF
MPGTQYEPELLVEVAGMNDLVEVDSATVITRPEPVRFLAIQNTSDTAVTLLWNPPRSNFTHYELFVAGKREFYSTDKTVTEYTLEYEPNVEFIATLYTTVMYPGGDRVIYSRPTSVNAIIGACRTQI